MTRALTKQDFMGPKGIIIIALAVFTVLTWVFNDQIYGADSVFYQNNFGNSALKALTLAGIDTVDQLKAMSDAEIAAIPGLDAKKIARIKKVLSYDEDDEGMPFRQL